MRKIYRYNSTAVSAEINWWGAGVICAQLEAKFGRSRSVGGFMVLGVHCSGMGEHHCPVCDAELVTFKVIGGKNELDCPFAHRHTADELAGADLPIKAQ